MHSNVTSSLTTYVRGLVAGGQYRIGVIAMNDVGNSSTTWGSCVGRGAVPAPAVPSNLTALATASGITVSWSINDVEDVASCSAWCGKACGGASAGIACTWSAIDSIGAASSAETLSATTTNLSCVVYPHAHGRFVFHVSCSNDNSTSAAVGVTNKVTFPPTNCSTLPAAPASAALFTVDRYRVLQPLTEGYLGSTAF